MLEQLSQLFEFLWGGPLFLCVIGIGFYFTVRLKFFQIINLKKFTVIQLVHLPEKINKTLLARQRLKNP